MPCYTISVILAVFEGIIIQNRCKVTTIFSNIQDLDAKKYNMLAIF
jgi:hypothetical protein